MVRRLNLAKPARRWWAEYHFQILRQSCQAPRRTGKAHPVSLLLTEWEDYETGLGRDCTHRSDHAGGGFYTSRRRIGRAPARFYLRPICVPLRVVAPRLPRQAAPAGASGLGAGLLIISGDSEDHHRA